MITCNKFSTAKAVGILFLCLLGACSEKEVIPQKQATSQAETAQDKISDEVKAQFVKLGFNVSDIKLIADDNPLNKESGKKNYLLEGDIVITPENLQSMLGSSIHANGAVNEQYRTSNLVDTGWPYLPQRTIRVYGVTSGAGSLNLDPIMKTALGWAVDNYNNLYDPVSFNVKFSLTFGSFTNSQTGYDIVVIGNPSRKSDDVGAFSEFPSGGNPGKWIYIYSNTSILFNTNVVEHVFTHEIGHCMGLRHTDWATNWSCSSGDNEGSMGVGHEHIPGTPIGYDANSVMLRCFSSTETGEFDEFDKVALRFLY